MGDLSAYLVEARSIAGISGSPVFVDINSSLPAFRNRDPSFFLIGLMHGHYDVKELTNNDAIVDDGIQKTSVNMGISIVIPAEEITAVIKKFSDGDQKAVADYRKRNAPTMDVLGAEPTQKTPGPGGTEIPIPTDHLFWADLKKASRKK